MTSKKYQLTKGASKTPIYPISYAENIKINETENLDAKLTSIDTEIAALKDAPGGGETDLTNYYNKQETDTLISGTYEGGELSDAIAQQKEITAEGICTKPGFRGGIVYKLGDKAFIIGALKELPDDDGSSDDSIDCIKCILVFDLVKRVWLDEYYAELPVDTSAYYTTGVWYVSGESTFYFTEKYGNSGRDLEPTRGSKYRLSKYSIAEKKASPVWNHIYNPDEQSQYRNALNAQIVIEHRGFIYGVMPNIFVSESDHSVYKIAYDDISTAEVLVCDGTAVPADMKYTKGGYAVVNNKAYFCAKGVQTKDPYKLYSFTFATGAYTTLGTLPAGFICITNIVAKDNNTLLVAHQDVDPNNLELAANNDLVLEYNITDNTWKKLETKNKFTDKFGSVGIFYEKSYYIFGGNAKSTNGGEIISFGDKTLTETVSSKPSKTVLQGNADLVDNYMGKDGELVYDNTSKSLRIMDGKKRGGKIVLDAYTKNESDNIISDELKKSADGGELIESTENTIINGRGEFLYHASGFAMHTVQIGDILYLVGAKAYDYSPNSPFEQDGVLIRAINIKTREWVKECKCDIDYETHWVTGAWATPDNSKIQFTMRVAMDSPLTEYFYVLEYTIATNSFVQLVEHIEVNTPTYINALDGDNVIEYDGYLYNIPPTRFGDDCIYRMPKDVIEPGHDELMCTVASYTASCGINIGISRACAPPTIYGDKAYWHTGGYNEYDDVFRILCYNFTTNTMTEVCKTCEHINTLTGMVLVDENTIMVPGQYYDLNPHCDGLNYEKLPRKNILMYDIPSKTWSMHEKKTSLNCSVRKTIIYNNDYYFIGGQSGIDPNEDGFIEIMSLKGATIPTKTPKTLIKGSSDLLSSYVGVEGQLVYNSTEKAIRIMDGKTPGGLAIAGSGGGTPEGGSYTKEEVDKIVTDAVAAAILQMTNKITTDITALETGLVDKYVGADEIEAVVEPTAEEADS